MVWWLCLLLENRFCLVLAISVFDFPSGASHELISNPFLFSGRSEGGRNTRVTPTTTSYRNRTAKVAGDAARNALGTQRAGLVWIQGSEEPGHQADCGSRGLLLAFDEEVSIEA